MKKKKICFRIIIFLFIFVVLYTVTTEIFADKRVELEYDVTAKVKGFYQEPKDTLDFVFVGSSQLYADIAPNVLFTEYGITSYDFCANEQPLWISYYYIKEALKHQNPKAILLDVFTVYGDDYEQEGVNHINLDDLPWNIDKWKAIRDAVPNDLRGSFYLELVKYHDTWNTLDQTKIMNSFYNKRNVYKGYSPFVVRHDYANEAPLAVISQKDREEIPERAKIWLDKIVELTNEEGVDLILIKTPNGNEERQKLYNSVSDYAKEKNIPFVNMNTVFDGEAHLNILQAERVTKYLGDYLISHYDLEDKRQNPEYDLWKEDSIFFYHKKAKCEQISIDSMKEYFEKLSQNDYMTMVAIKSSNISSIPEETREILSHLGIKPDYSMQGEVCYLALIRNGDSNVLNLQLNDQMIIDSFNQSVIADSEERAIYDYLISKEYTLEASEIGINPKKAAPKDEKLNGKPYKFEISAKLGENGIETGLIMNGDNFSLDHKGINVFVFDPAITDIVEFVSFDEENGFTIRRDE